MRNLNEDFYDNLEAPEAISQVDVECDYSYTDSITFKLLVFKIIYTKPLRKFIYCAFNSEFLKNARIVFNIFGKEECKCILENQEDVSDFIEHIEANLRTSTDILTNISFEIQFTKTKVSFASFITNILLLYRNLAHFSAQPKIHSFQGTNYHNVIQICLNNEVVFNTSVLKETKDIFVDYQMSTVMIMMRNLYNDLTGKYDITDKDIDRISDLLSLQNHTRLLLKEQFNRTTKTFQLYKFELPDRHTYSYVFYIKQSKDHFVSNSELMNFINSCLQRGSKYTQIVIKNFSEAAAAMDVKFDEYVNNKYSYHVQYPKFINYILDGINEDDMYYLFNHIAEPLSDPYVRKPRIIFMDIDMPVKSVFMHDIRTSAYEFEVNDPKEYKLTVLKTKIKLKKLL